MNENAQKNILLKIDKLSKHFEIEQSYVNLIVNYFSRKEKKIVQALDKVSLVLKEKETLGILGESGSGKSTLARVLMGIYEPDAGTAQLGQKNVFTSDSVEKLEVLKEMQMVFQDPFGSLDPRMTIRQILSEPLKIHSLCDKNSDKLLGKTLEEVGMESSALTRYPSEFSGGQRQRIGICRALLLSPKIIIADEAVSALDVSVQAQILNLLHELKQKRALSMIFISHDVAVVRQISDRILLIYKGSIVEEMDSDCLLKDTFHPYSKKLLEAAVFLREGEGNLIQNESVALNENFGCPYLSKCEKSFDKCKQKPEMFKLHHGHKVACWLAEKK